MHKSINQFKNYWGFGQGMWVGGSWTSNADLRGGPSIKYPGNINYWYWIGTNSRKKVRASFNNWFNWGQNDFRKSSGISININMRPTDALQISFSPNVSWNRNDLQYITQRETQGETTFILGRVEQKTYSISARANYNITPNLTLEFWGQPFIASGSYSQFKRVYQPNAEHYHSRFHLFENDEVVFDETNGEYQIFESGGTSADYTFDDPNFNVVQFRSNFVMRWEYIPGSTLFFVWSNNSSYFDQSRNDGFDNLLSHLPDLTGTNTFLIKYTYRFIL